MFAVFSLGGGKGLGFRTGAQSKMWELIDVGKKLNSFVSRLGGGNREA